MHRIRPIVIAAIASLLLALNTAPALADDGVFDLVILDGRVMDPESGREAVLNVGIRDGRIAALTNTPLSGKRTLKAAGRLVTPGYIDLHTHTPFPFGELLQVKDGVTTALDLEAGAFPPAAYGEFIRGHARANYAASVGHYAIRMKVIDGMDQPYLLTRDGPMRPVDAFTKQATPTQIEDMRRLLQQGLDEGGLGIGFLLDYMTEAVSDQEMRMVFEVAAANQTVVWTHIRRGINGDIQPLHDVLAMAEQTGAKLHICHINANAMGAIGEWLQAIDAANARGANVSTEIFPFTAGSTSISADVFNRDWRTIFNIDYHDVQWGPTGEFFTEESWYRTRKEHPTSDVIHHYMKEEWIVEALKWPKMMLVTDAMPALNFDIKAVPNGAASFTRLMARHVRDNGVMDLMEGLRRTAYYPAERLAEFAPRFRNKGRIKVGADADLLVFKLENLRDNATYMDPYRETSGYDWIIVGGEVVIAGGDPVGATPGQPVFNLP